MLEHGRVDTRHRWLDILTALGVPAKFLRNRHGPCPMCPRQPEVRMSMCPVLGTLVPSGIHRTYRIVAGLAVLSVLASKIQTWSHLAQRRSDRGRALEAGRARYGEGPWLSFDRGDGYQSPRHKNKRN